MFEHSIQLNKNTIIKRDNPSLMQIEVKKTERAYEIGKQSGLFRVPMVLDYNDTKGIATFERIPKIRNICNLSDFKSNPAPFLETIGKILAIIHKELKLPENLVQLLPKELRYAGNEVFLHGDFNGHNVCFSEVYKSIIILDWQMTGVHGGQATYGTHYFDLVWFMNYFFWQPLYQFRTTPNIQLIKKHFIRSYFSLPDYDYNHDEFIKYIKQFFKVKLYMRKKQLSWKRRILYLPNRLRLYSLYT